MSYKQYKQLRDMIDKAWCFSSDNTYAIKKLCKILEIVVDKLEEVEK